jgi:hypothetical protein
MPKRTKFERDWMWQRPAPLAEPFSGAIGNESTGRERGRARAASCRKSTSFVENRSPFLLEPKAPRYVREWNYSYFYERQPR